MKEFEYMSPPAGAKSAKRTGLGRWSAGNGTNTWRFSTAPLSVPIFFPLRSPLATTETHTANTHTEEPSDSTQLDLRL
jgi:hypothetical protein